MRDELSDFIRVERGDLTDAGVTTEVVLIDFSARYRLGSLSVIGVYLQGEGERWGIRVQLDFFELIFNQVLLGHRYSWLNLSPLSRMVHVHVISSCEADYCSVLLYLWHHGKLKVPSTWHTWPKARSGGRCKSSKDSDEPPGSNLPFRRSHSCLLALEPGD